MSTYLLIHGAWHTGKVWNGVATRLAAKGHNVIALSLPMAPGATIADYVECVASAIEDLDEPATVVAHSSAGFLLQAALSWSTIRAKVSRAVYLAAWLLEPGKCQFDLVPAAVADGMRAAATACGGVVPVDRAFVAGVLMPDEPSAKVDALIAQLVPQPIGLFTGYPGVTGGKVVAKVPTTVILPKGDQSAPYEAMAAGVLAPGYGKIEIAGGHEVHFTHPELVAAVLLALAS